MSGAVAVADDPAARSSARAAAIASSVPNAARTWSRRPQMLRRTSSTEVNCSTWTYITGGSASTSTGISPGVIATRLAMVVSASGLQPASGTRTMAVDRRGRGRSTSRVRRAFDTTMSRT